MPAQTGQESYAHHGRVGEIAQIGDVPTLGGDMRVHQIMTPGPTCCTPDSTAREAASLMKEHDCGSIPVVEHLETRRLVGTVTDQIGQRYHLVGINQSIVAPEFTSPEDFVFRHTNIKIKLTPIGG